MKEIIICNTTNYGSDGYGEPRTRRCRLGAKLAGVREGMTAKERNGNERR